MVVLREFSDIDRGSMIDPGTTEHCACLRRVLGGLSVIQAKTADRETRIRHVRWRPTKTDDKYQSRKRPHALVIQSEDHLEKADECSRRSAFVLNLNINTGRYRAFVVDDC